MRWFKHMSDMRHDVKVDRLISKYGLEGYGLYVLILECISDRLESKSPVPDLEENSLDIARKYSIDTVRCEEIMMFCVQQGLFDSDEVTGRIVCHKMYKFLDTSMTGSPELRKMITNYKEKHDVMICHDMSGSVKTEQKRIEKNIYIDDILDYWNSKDVLPTHKKEVVNRRIQKKHRMQIDEYGKESVLKAIDNYAQILANPHLYYFSYRWSIWDFLARGLDRFIEEMKPLDNFKKNGANKEEDKMDSFWHGF